MSAKQPTNYELLQEFQTMNSRVSSLENWRIASDAYKTALVEVRKEDKAKSDQEKKSEIFKQVTIILGLIIAILTTVAAANGAFK